MFNHAVDCLNCVVSCHMSVSTHFTLIIHFKCLIMLYLYLLNHNHNILQNMSHFFSEWMWHVPRLPGYLVRLSGISLCARRACKFVQLHRQTLGKRATEAHCWRPPAAFHAKPWPFKNKKKKRGPIPFHSIRFRFHYLFVFAYNRTLWFLVWGPYPFYATTRGFWFIRVWWMTMSAVLSIISFRELSFSFFGFRTLLIGGLYLIIEVLKIRANSRNFLIQEFVSIICYFLYSF